MNFFIKILTVFILFVGIFSSCTEEESCREENEVYLRVGFYSAGTLNQISVDSIWVKGIGVDEYLYTNTKKAKQILLPLKKNGNQSDFIIRVNNETDTLKISHTNQEYLIDYNCGCIITHQIDTILNSNHGIQISKIENHSVETNVQEHIQLYY